MKNKIKSIKEFCNGIKYFEHIKLVDGCLYAVYGIKNKRKNLFNNIYDAVKFAYIHRTKLVKRFGCVCIMAYNLEDKIFDEKEYIERSIFEIKEAATEYAKLRCFYISPSFEQIYMETIEAITGKHLVENFSKPHRSCNFTFEDNMVTVSIKLSYDYELLYNPPFKLKENVTYISSFKEAKDFHYYSVGKKSTKVRSPMTLMQEDIMSITNTEYKGDDLYYGIRGYTQRSTKSGLILDWYEETFNTIVPIASLSEYTVKRPKIKGITRYKVSVSIDNNTDNPIIDTVYVDCKDGDIEKAKREALDNHWSGPATVIDIQTIPDGEWI